MGVGINENVASQVLNGWTNEKSKAGFFWTFNLELFFSKCYNVNRELLSAAYKLNCITYKGAL